MSKRVSRYFLSTVFVGLFATSMALSPAQGQEQSMNPKGPWSIAKIDRTAKGANSYCTLSRKYDGDVVLSLGRSQTEEYSLAIDFQKPVFEAGKAVKITLQPGPGQIRAYDMMPTSEKAIVIRLGWDTGFFDALNQSQQIKAKIGDKSYTFSVPEIAKGQTDLRNCMEELKTAGKGGALAASGKDVLMAEAGSSSHEFDATKNAVKVASAGPAKEEEKNEESLFDRLKGSAPKTNDEIAPKTTLTPQNVRRITKSLLQLNQILQALRLRLRPPLL
jgi:hypothetical protein